MVYDTLQEAALDAQQSARRTGQRHCITRSPYGFHSWPVSPAEVLNLPARRDPTFNAVAAADPNRLQQDEVILAVVAPSGTCNFRSRC